MTLWMMPAMQYDLQMNLLNMILKKLSHTLNLIWKPTLKNISLNLK